MNKKQLGIALSSIFVSAFLMSTITLSNNIMAFAQIGFGLGNGTQTLGESQSSFQGARCYSPTGSIVLSCNTGDLSTSTNTGINSFAQ
jgi:hypothetical protein